MSITTVKLQTVTVYFSEYAGDTLFMRFNYNNADGTPVVLTGFTAKMQVCTDVGTTPLLTLTDTSGITLGGTPNNLLVEITSIQTGTTLGIGTYVYDIRLTDSAGNVSIPVTGQITLLESITT